MFKDVSSKLLALIAGVCFVVFSSYVSAFDEYQFSVSLLAQEDDYEAGATSDAYSGGASAYIEPVVLDGKVPYSEAWFWSRTSSVSASWYQREFSDFLVIRGGNILESIEGEGGHLSFRLADEELPVWFRVSAFYQDESKFSYIGAGSFRTEDRLDKQYTLGLYVSDWVSMDLSYYDLEGPDRRYRLSFDGLVPLLDKQFLGFDVYYERLEREDLELNQFSGVIRNLAFERKDLDSAFLSVSYFPDASLKLSFSYWAGENDIGWGDGPRVTGLAVSYFLHHLLELGLGYSRTTDSLTLSPEGLDYDSYALQVTTRF